MMMVGNMGVHDNVHQLLTEKLGMMGLDANSMKREIEIDIILVTLFHT